MTPNSAFGLGKIAINLQKFVIKTLENVIGKM